MRVLINHQIYLQAWRLAAIQYLQFMAGVVVAVTEIGADDVTVADVDCSQPAASFANTV